MVVYQNIMVLNINYVSSELASIGVGFSLA